MKQIEKSILQSLAGITVCINIISCSSNKEIRVSDAKPGDTLVVVEDERIVLVDKFKPGQPNGLFDGSVKIISKNKPERLTEVNAICSMPDLPNWPEYDNIYGRWLEPGEAPGIEGGDTDWQLLIYFDGNEQNKGREPAPTWAQKLAKNACRKGKFQDN